jgi:hypothetical protein
VASSKTNGKLSAAPKIARNGNQETSTPQVPEPPKRTLRISTVSHTLDSQVAEKLRYFAFRERISESAVIEFALRVFFESGDDPELGTMLRTSGAALRRKS